MRYKILGTSHIKSFIHIMTQLNITHNDAITTGVSEDDINKVNNIAVDKDIVIFALPEDLLSCKNMNRVFNFVPMNKESGGNSGVFIPIEVGDNIDNYNMVIETSLLQDNDLIKDLSNEFPKSSEQDISDKFPRSSEGKRIAMGDIQKSEMPSKEKVKPEGRPNRKKVIGGEDIKKMNKLLKNDKNIDVTTFLKLID